jgi:hypothetical protein
MFFLLGISHQLSAISMSAGEYWMGVDLLKADF